MSSFDAINGYLCRMKGYKSHHGIRDFLDETVILFNQVIQYLTWSISLITKIRKLSLNLKNFAIEPDLSQPSMLS